MNNKISKFIDDVLLESALDSRINDGMIDLTKFEHIDVVYEVLQNKGFDEESADQLLEGMLAVEGKYPDRQAFNKEGWLVTFPSKEYRDVAIKKGTHSISDPTHGKGGMNLYYKKRGKQKRQTQQQTSSAATTQQAPTAASVKRATQPSQAQQPTAQQPSGEKKNELPPEGDDETPMSNKDIEKIKAAADAKYGNKGAQAPAAAEKPEAPAPETPAPAAAPAIDVPVVTTPPEQYAFVSKKFAAKKGWISEPYGEYRDGQGNPVAVVGLSGEVVPIKNTDREEYKLFAEKNKV